MKKVSLSKPLTASAVKVGDTYTSPKSGKSGVIVQIDPNGKTGSVSMKIQLADGSFTWTSVKPD